MSQMHQCNDGTQDYTGRGNPGKIPCLNNGGVVGSVPPVPVPVPPPVMNPNYVPPHLRTDFNPDDPIWDNYVVPPAIMKDANGNDVPGNPYYAEEIAFWENHRAPVIPIYNIGEEIVFIDMSTCPDGGPVPDECIKEVRGVIIGMDDTSVIPRYEVELLNGDIKYIMEDVMSPFEPLGLETSEEVIVLTETKTAGFGDNKMLIWLVVGGLALWYLNKEGYLKKILK